MELYFETYLIITFLFAILAFFVAGLYLKSKKHTISLSALILVSGVVLPLTLISLQFGYGSLGEIDLLMLENRFLQQGLTIEEFLISGGCIYGMTTVELTVRYFTQNLGFIILSIVTGIALGVLAYLLLKKRRSAVKP